jgi:hypothetical protein
MHVPAGLEECALTKSRYRPHPFGLVMPRRGRTPAIRSIMKISQRRWLSAVRMAAVTGLTMLITGLAGALFRRAAKKAVKKQQSAQIAREDAEAKARMDGEGGSMQPVAVH